MKIYSMTATFGKLDHETLNLQPGLNILEAPNEWGKSTWCAFLTAMFYGLETRAKSTKNALADKDHFAPWSGKPMSGRIDLNWNGRNITIERTTKGRVPMGEFRAYETETGLEVPELDGMNCGQMLLGVERSVFVRSGFIRLSDLPVTDDETLRRRLNALVTTGDESGRADRLAAGLKELKNRIRYNRTGLLPQAETERNQLESTLREMMQLQEQLAQDRERLDQVKDWQILLENHRTALNFTAAREKDNYVQQALRDLETAQQQLETVDAQCALYPDRETARQVLEEIEWLRREQQRLETILANLAAPEEPAELSGMFAGMSPDEAISAAKADRIRHWSLSERKYLLLVIGILLLLCGIGVAFWHRIAGVVCGAVGVCLLLTDLVSDWVRRKRKRELETHYADQIADLWLRKAERYAAWISACEDREREILETRELLDSLLANVEQATEGRGLEACREEWQEVLDAWKAQEAAKQSWQQASTHYQSLKAMAKAAPAPEFPDRMDYSEEETQGLLAECLARQQQLENRIGQLQGQMTALGEPAEQTRKLEAVNRRIGQLEKIHTALILAQETLHEAAADLQRRFAPRIAKRAQTLMEKLTDGRYDRLSLSDDLSLRTGAGQEDTLREVLWRSDGTVDQLYLALRLAVAGELAPNAPLILDDALVRFDDTRLKAALEILKEEAQTKQVILFTCHSRETKLL